MKIHVFLVALSLLMGNCAVARTADEEVASALQGFYQALNDADADAAARYLLPGGSSFPRSGAPLDPEAPTAEQSLKNLRASFAAGLRFHVTLRDVHVTSYGDAALATFYTEGNTTGVDKTVAQGVYRASYLFVKKADGWKIAHFHISPLRSQG
jgi:ketosteroid isomerase-like protein